MRAGPLSASLLLGPDVAQTRHRVEGLARGVRPAQHWRLCAPRLRPDLPSPGVSWRDPGTRGPRQLERVRGLGPVPRPQRAGGDRQLPSVGRYFEDRLPPRSGGGLEFAGSHAPAVHHREGLARRLACVGLQRHFDDALPWSRPERGWSAQHLRLHVFDAHSRGGDVHDAGAVAQDAGGLPRSRGQGQRHQRGHDRLGRRRRPRAHRCPR
mmetsp:Transcript_99298/g.303648  ORF Transcript_99298/g.303648 Transcript_99298/m.303648 type:complete len:210 (-) Transcript_99298:455-1084(-)